jgi:hypothetical protein
LVCLLLSTSVSDLKESPAFKRVPKDAKSTRSSKSSSISAESERKIDEPKNT